MKRLLPLVLLLLLFAGCGHSPAPTEKRSPVLSLVGHRHHFDRRLQLVSFGTAAAPQVGLTLNVTNGVWANTPTSFAYQWRSCDNTGASCSDLTGQTSNAYTIVSGDVGHTLRAVVTATNSSGSTSQTSAATGVITSPGGGGTVPFVDGVCSPSACTAGSGIGYTITAADSSAAPYGTATPSTQNIHFTVQRPTNLSSATQAPAVIVTCGPVAGNPQWTAAAPVDKFVLITVESTIPFPGGGRVPTCNFQGAATSWQGTSQGIHTCGVSGTDRCDNIPGLVAVLNAVECNGAAPCQNINPSEVFITGASEGGQFAEAAMCDTRTSSKFAGIQVVSDLLVSPGRPNPGLTASSTNAMNPNCPALLGVGSRCYWDCVVASPNRNISMQWIWGTADNVFGGSNWSCPVGSNCVGTGLYSLASPDWWFWGDIDLAQKVLGPVEGCPATPATIVLSGTPNSTGVQTSTYTPCSLASSPTQAATQLVQITGASHLPDTWPPGTNLNGSDGYQTAAGGWNFWRQYFK